MISAGEREKEREREKDSPEKQGGRAARMSGCKVHTVREGQREKEDDREEEIPVEVEACVYFSGMNND